MSLAEEFGFPPEPDETDRLLDALEPVLAKYRDSKERRESLVRMRAVCLAPNLATCEEILRTGRVPKSLLDPKWAKAYGLL